MTESNPIVSATITALAYGGAGIGDITSGDYQGLKVFVPFTIPGEEVQVELTEIKKRYARGLLNQIKIPSADRVTPLCGHFGVCGGCELQHVTYSGELLWKQQLIASSLDRGKVLELNDPRLHTMEPADPYGYRRRLKLHLSRNGEFGYYERGSHALVPLKECPVLLPVLEQTVKLLAKQTLPSDLSGVLLLESDGVRVVATCHLDYYRPAQCTALKGLFAEIFAHISIYAEDRLLFEQRIAGFTPTVPAGAFSQGNSEINQKLIAFTSAEVAKRDAYSICDLYAGAGNFGLPLARQNRKIVSVERSRVLSSEAQRQAQKRNVDAYFRVECSDVVSFLKKSTERFDLVIADPPRAGFREAIPFFRHSDRLLLIFCELPSAVRDLKDLIDQGWHIDLIKPFDMFPRTSRVELVALLSR
jgi:23S rRNA (uracil1939-C5)-methyltransferase